MLEYIGRRSIAATTKCSTQMLAGLSNGVILLPKPRPKPKPTGTVQAVGGKSIAVTVPLWLLVCYLSGVGRGDITPSPIGRVEARTLRKEPHCSVASAGLIGWTTGRAPLMLVGGWSGLNAAGSGLCGGYRAAPEWARGQG